MDDVPCAALRLVLVRSAWSLSLAFCEGYEKDKNNEYSSGICGVRHILYVNNAYHRYLCVIIIV